MEIVLDLGVIIGVAVTGEEVDAVDGFEHEWFPKQKEPDGHGPSSSLHVCAVVHVDCSWSSRLA